MKAKRLRALLVAGLLSLAPAVTLTSCGGGGGGGGGTATVDELPSSIAGHTLTLIGQNGDMKIVFSPQNICTAELLYSNGGTQSFSGNYTYDVEAGDQDATSDVELRYKDSLNTKYAIHVNFTVGPSGGILAEALLRSNTGGLERFPVNKCSFK